MRRRLRSSLDGLRLGFVVQADVVGEAGDQGLEGGVEEVVLVDEVGQALVDVVTERLGLLVVVLVPDQILEMAANPLALELHPGVTVALGGLAVGLGGGVGLAGLGGFLAIEALFQGDGLAQVAAGLVEGPARALERLVVGRRLLALPRLDHRPQAHLGHDRQHRVDTFRGEDRGCVHIEQI